jgi:outer membrane lipoprotein-sorting protein
MKQFLPALILAIILTLVSRVPVSAQSQQFLSNEDSDPNAVQLLEKLYQKLNSGPVSLDFDITVSYPAEEPLVQQGSMVQQGNMYRIQTDEADIWCNGALRWIMVKGTQEASLYSAADDTSIGPAGMIAEYTGDGFIAAVTGEEKQPGKQKHLLIELKPVDRNSHIAKVRITVEESGNPIRMEIFEKNAARTVLNVKSITHPKAQQIAYFTFDKAQYPGVHIEDLRID